MRLGVLGIGQAGGNIAAEFARLGYHAAAINLSRADLESIADRVAVRLLLPGSEGAAKDPGAGFGAVEANAEQIMELIRREFAECAVLLVAFSLGGGTGSGAGPAVVELASGVFPDRPVGAIVVLPALEESSVLQGNAIEAFADLSRVQRLGAVLVVDNERAFDLLRRENADTGRPELYAATNGTLARLVHNLLEVPRMSSSLGNVDEAEIIALFSTRGAMMIGEAVLPEGGPSCSTDTATLVRYSLTQDGIFALSDLRTARAAVVWQAPAEWTRHLRIAEILDPLPAEVHEGIYDDPRGRILTVLAGLPWPVARLRGIESRLEAERREIEATMTAAETQEYQPGVSISLRRRISGTGGEVSVAEILARHRRR